MRLKWALLIVAAGGGLFQVGCLRTVQQNLDLLFAPEANLESVYQSQLVDIFGPDVLMFW